MPAKTSTAESASRHLSSNGTGSNRNVAYPYLSLRSVAYRCLSLPIVAYRCLSLLLVAYRCFSLLTVAYRCLLLLIVAYRCLSLLIVAYRCLSVLVVPPLTMLCTLLYFTLRYLTSLGVTAGEGAIDITNAFQEIMFKCSKMLYNFDSGITYKLSCNACRRPMLL